MKKKITLYYILFIVIFSFIIIPNLDAFIFIADLMISYLVFIDHSLFANYFHKSVVIIMENAKTGELRKFSTYIDLYKHLDRLRLQLNIHEDIKGIESNVRHALTERITYKNFYFHGLDDEVRTDLTFTPHVESELKDSYSVRDRYAYLCQNEAGYLMKTLHPDVEKDYDPNNLNTEVTEVPNIPDLDLNAKRVLLRLITITRERLLMDPAKPYTQQLSFIINYLDKSIHEPDKKTCYIIMRLAQKHIYETRDIDRSIEGYIKVNHSIK